MSELIRPAPLGRRLAAGVYDSLLVIALWFFMGFAALLFTGGEAVPVGDAIFQTLVFGLTAAFFVLFWRRGGQTLGMRAWRLQARQSGGGQIQWWQGLLRISFAPLIWLPAGLGLLSMYLHPQRRAWHELLSGTETVLLPPPRPQHQKKD